MFYLVSYDVVDDKRRNKLAKKLKDYGKRVQYSVFECLLNEEKIKELEKAILPFFNQDEDSIRIYGLCQACSKNVKVLGIGDISQDPEVYIV